MNTLRKFFLTSLVTVTSAFAVPELQLDILGGVYDLSDQTIVATSPQFTLRTLVKGAANLNSLYYISAAIEPGLVETFPAPNIGSFSINGVTYTSANLNWGVPPLNIPDVQPGDLAPHNIYPTYYAELSFYVLSTSTVASYNTQTHTLEGPGSLYYRDFSVDVSGLAAGFNLHFDFYDEKVKRGVYTVDDFAPFSHDAASGSHQVSDGGWTHCLIGLGFLGFFGLRTWLGRSAS